MTSDSVTNLKKWLKTYADTFIQRATDPAPYLLKKAHTFRVCREIVDLGRDLALSPKDLLLAEAAACLHDVGRFRQMEKYGTFVDDLSEDHARLGLQVINEKKLLDEFSVEQSHILRSAVAFHNAAKIPDGQNDKALLFIKLLRDADKLDIWRVVTADYKLSDAATPDFVRLGLKDDGLYSPQALQAIKEKRLINKSVITRLNDFKLMQISWVFDINFTPALQKVRDRGYIPAIIATLPASDELNSILNQVEEYMIHIDPTVLTKEEPSPNKVKGQPQGVAPTGRG